MATMPNHTKPPSHQVDSALSAFPPESSPLRKIVVVASVSTGIQFGWALQLALLTPYVQLLGVPHKWASYIWLCGPISGLLVQPVVGYHSDRCTSRFGRRRPFIAAGCCIVFVSVFLIGYSPDLGHMFGDSLEKKMRPRAIVIFVVGFGILDVANNMLQGPCRAFLADLAAGDQRKTRIANAFFSFFIAVGNVLSFAAGASNKIYHVFPFTKTKACNEYCAHVKSCFFLSITLLITLATAALVYVKERPFSEPKGNEGDDSVREGTSGMQCFGQMFGALRDLKRPMWILLLVTFLNWFAWFPFLMFDTDWMGTEVYGGKVGRGRAYETGVRAGSLGLMLNAVVLGVVSLGLEVLAREVGGVKRLWGIVNFMLAASLASTVLITKMAEHSRRYAPGSDDPLPPTGAVKGSALALFLVLGIPSAVTFSVPFALASMFSSSSGAGQGLSLGVLNLAIVIPQMVVAVMSGPWDDLFGGSNLPSFVMAAVAAAASGILSILLLPSPPPDAAKAVAAGGGGFH